MKSMWNALVPDTKAALETHFDAIVLELPPTPPSQPARFGARATDGFYVGTPATLSKLLMRWSDERFWHLGDLAADGRGAGRASQAQHLVLYEDYVARCAPFYGIQYLPARAPEPEVMGRSRDGLFTHIRAYGPKAKQWEFAKRHDPLALSVWRAVEACEGPCKVVWSA